MTTFKKYSRPALLIGSFALMVLFQNMSLVEFSKLDIAAVDEEARRDQAQELLGAYYRGSHAQKLEGQQYLNYLVYKKIDEALGPRWKSRVPELAQAIITESQRHQFDPVFILAVIQTESTFNPLAKGTSGELGLMQVLPRTAEWMAKKYRLPWKGPEALYDPATNVKFGIIYFAHLRDDFDGTAYRYIPAYNMGPANMRKIERTIGSVDANGQVPKREYAVRVMKNYVMIYQQLVKEQKKMEQLAKADSQTSQVQ